MIKKKFQNNVVYLCEICDLKTNKLDTFKNHSCRKETDKISYVCYYCKKIFISEIGLILHKKYCKFIRDK